MNIKHLGLMIREKDSNHISKERYLSAKPEGFNGWEERHFAAQVLKASLNYDLNMRYFESLDEDHFNTYLQKFCKKNKLKECTNLNELDGVCGVYIIVLDRYKQFYIGKSENIKKRIKGHWNHSKSLERLIFGDVCSSIISIDSFGALDTTRVFFRKCWDPMEVEAKLVETVDKRYTINRTSGGIGSHTTYTADAIAANFAVIAGRRKRDLIPFLSIEELREVVSEESFTNYYLERYPELSNK